MGQGGRSLVQQASQTHNNKEKPMRVLAILTLTSLALQPLCSQVVELNDQFALLITPKWSATTAPTASRKPSETQPHSSM